MSIFDSNPDEDLGALSKRLTVYIKKLRYLEDSDCPHHHYNRICSMLVGDEELTSLGDILLEEALGVYKRYSFPKRMWNKTKKLWRVMLKQSKPSKSVLPVSWLRQQLFRMMSSGKSLK